MFTNVTKITKLIFFHETENWSKLDQICIPTYGDWEKIESYKSTNFNQNVNANQCIQKLRAIN